MIRLLKIRNIGAAGFGEPTNYLVYLGLRNYDDPEVSRQFAQKSYDLFLQEWKRTVTSMKTITP